MKELFNVTVWSALIFAFANLRKRLRVYALFYVRVFVLSILLAHHSSLMVTSSQLNRFKPSALKLNDVHHYNKPTLSIPHQMRHKLHPWEGEILETRIKLLGHSTVFSTTKKTG
uniref:Uncharacterized protein n=1 Tax=Glossina pallidipes TaxID=7398 RepID=A0A1A9ZFN1_GLOPL